MWIYVLIAVFVVVLAVLYSQVYRPRSILNRYYAQFSPHVKTYLYPLHPFSAPMFDIDRSNQKKYHDFYLDEKNKLPAYEVALQNFGDKAHIVLISPNMIRAFHELDQQKLYKKYQFVLQNLKRMVGDGITFSVGEKWKNKRKVLTSLLNYNYISSIVPKISAIVQEKASAIDTARPVDLQSLMTTIASTVVIHLFFGGSKINFSTLKIEGEPINDYFFRLFMMICDQTLDPWTIILGQKFVKLGLRKGDRQVNAMLLNFNQFTGNFVRDRLYQLENSKQAPSNTPSDLIQAYHIMHPQTPVQDLINDFSTLYLAGTDTTSHSAHMALHYIGLNPKVEQKLLKEIKQLGKQITWQQMKKMSYLDAVVMQTLRMYGTANGIFPREAVQDHQIQVSPGKSVTIYKGTIVATQSVTTHYISSIYPQPHIFNPDRFLNSPPLPFSHMTFSAGSRSCIGKQLALTQMKTIIIEVLKRWHVKVEGEGSMDMNGFTYSPKGFVYYLEERLP